MIHYIKVRNFMSFKDEVCLDFEATDDKRLEDYHVVEMADGTRILRFSVLYGANASGKTNLVKVIEFLRLYWSNVEGNKIRTIPFLFDDQTSKEPTEIEVAFYVGDNRYEYYLKMTGNTTIYEELFLCNTEQPISIIKRERKGKQRSEITFNPDIVDLSEPEVKAFSVICLEQMSFFAARDKLNFSEEIPYFDEVWVWTISGINHPIGQNTVDLYGNEMEIAWEELIAEDDDARKYIIDFVHKADFNIINIETKNDNSSTEDNVHNKKTLFTHNISKQKNYKLPSYFQSGGTLRTVALGALLYEAHKYNAFVAIDEIETSLHPELVEFIIGQFLEEEPNRSQMLITTHYAKLLDTVDDLLRRDSVWFVEKHENGSSELYSLIEFKGVDDMDHLHGAYMNGRFGALPHLKY